jgi:hypothetical protein
MDEDSMVVDRPAKKRKVSPSTDGLHTFHRFDDNPSPSTVRTLMRVKTHIGVPHHSPTPMQLLRSSSLKHRGEVKNVGRKPNFPSVSLTRPRHRTRSKDMDTIARAQVAHPITLDQALKDSTGASTNSAGIARHPDGVGRSSRSAPSSLVAESSCQRSHYDQIDADEGGRLVTGMGRATNASAMDVCDT